MAERIIEEARSFALDCSVVLWKELVFDLTADEARIRTKHGEDIRAYDIIWPRNIQASSYKKGRAKYLSLSRPDDLFVLLSQYCALHGIAAVNGDIVKVAPYTNKLCQYFRLIENKLPVIPSLLYSGEKADVPVYSYFKFPYIAKGTYGSKGRNVFLVRNREEIKALIKRFGFGKVLIQKYLPASWDYRVIVVGGRVLGVMKRTGRKGGFKNNFSAGASVSSVEAPKEVHILASKAAAVFNADFAGVDILEFEGAHYILEVNFFAGFEGFEKATGLNVPRTVFNFLLRSPNALAR